MSTDLDNLLALQCLKREGVPLLASEVARWSDMTPGAARRALQRLAAKGAAHQQENGYWALGNDGSGDA